MSGTVVDVAARDRLWAAVDQLTRPTTYPIRRDDGSVTYAAVPSLWEQAAEAAHGNLGAGDSGRTGVASERNLVDLDLLAVCDLIVGYTTRTLHAWGVDATGTPVPAALRSLASEALRREGDQLWWWEYRFTAWARLLSSLLAVGERRPGSLRLRNSPCPACRARRVTVDGDDGAVVVAPLLVEFRDGAVRAVRCSSCGRVWWRGDQLAELAGLLAS